MDVLSLAAEARTPGKRAARAARRRGAVPCVLYGPSVDPVSLTVSEKSLGSLIYTNVTRLVNVEIADRSWQCILKDIAFHPVTDRPMHADFQVLRAGSKVTLAVPLRYVGTPVGQVRGGDVRVVVHELVVSCLPKHIPSHMDVDVSHVQIGESVQVADLDFENLEYSAPAGQVLMMVERPRLVVEEEPEEEDLPEPDEE